MARLIAALDIGTTSVRCHIIDQTGTVKYSACSQIDLIYPKPGYVEIAPDHLWNKIFEVIKKAVEDGGYKYEDIDCLGISSQRCSFITWNKKTQEPYHNFITWKDIRADSMVNELNSSLSLKALHFGAKCMYTVTRNKRFLAGSVLKFMNSQVTVRLLWALKHVTGLKEDSEKDLVCFGTVDTWVLYKLSGGNLHVTDVSNASATGFYDPFTLSWADWAIRLFKIPKSILPEVVDSAGSHFGSVSTEIFGHPVKITCSIADQSASLLGSCCFDVGDLKVTMGTGTFLDVNTGNIPHASVAGLYPVIGWKFNNNLVYVAEGASNDTGSLMGWAMAIGLIETPKDCAAIAQSVDDNDGVFFIPAFSGLQAPINDSLAGAGFIGVKPTTTKAHLFRAILEAIVFRVTQLVRVFGEESSLQSSKIRVDGGVANNDFIVQTLADLTGLPIERPQCTEMSALGAAYLAGLSSGIWKSFEELSSLNRKLMTFTPCRDRGVAYSKLISKWTEAISRFGNWYSPECSTDPITIKFNDSS